MLKKASKVGEILVCLKKPTGNTPHYPNNSWVEHILKLKPNCCIKSNVREKIEYLKG